MATWVGIGSSRKIDAFQAGEEAALLARSQAQRPDLDLAIVFASSSFEQEELLKGIKSIVSEIPIIGCSTSGEITSQGPWRKSVAVIGIKSDKIKFATGLGKDVGEDARAAGYIVAKKAIEGGSEDRRVFIIFPDGLSGNGQDLIRGAQEILGMSFPIVGGSAGDDFLFQKTYQYYNDKPYVDSVVGILFLGDIAIGIGIRHGWRPLGRPRKVTRAKSNVLREIDGEPAIDIYKEYFDKEIEGLHKEFLPRVTIKYPLGMLMPGEEEYLMRNVLRVNTDGSLVCVAEVPEGTEVRLMIGSRDTALEAAKLAAQEAVVGMRGAEIKFAMVFDSVSRAKLLVGNIRREIEIIKRVLGEKIPLIGFYTYGEQAPLKSRMYAGQSYFHNESIVVLTVGERRYGIR
jgi:hypothetical protein